MQAICFNTVCVLKSQRMDLTNRWRVCDENENALYTRRIEHTTQHIQTLTEVRELCATASASDLIDVFRALSSALSETKDRLIAVLQKD